MALTPMDIIVKHLSAEQGKLQPLANVPALAIAINEELKQNFRIIAPAAPWATDDEALAAAPIPGSRPVMVTPTLRDGDVEISIRVNGNPSLWYMGTNLQPYRLDDETVPNTVGFPSGREAQIALALTDLSASRLHKVTK